VNVLFDISIAQSRQSAPGPSSAIGDPAANVSDQSSPARRRRNQAASHDRHRVEKRSRTPVRPAMNTETLLDPNIIFRKNENHAILLSMAVAAPSRRRGRAHPLARDRRKNLEDDENFATPKVW
jgi:hypothetical protein